MWLIKALSFADCSGVKLFLTDDKDGSEVERWSWLSSYIKQSSSQNIYAANRHPCPQPTQPIHKEYNF